jgi:hypothetical protein
LIDRFIEHPLVVWAIFFGFLPMISESAYFCRGVFSREVGSFNKDLMQPARAVKSYA